MLQSVFPEGYCPPSKVTLDSVRPNNSGTSGVRGFIPSFILLVAGGILESCLPLASLHATSPTLPPGLSTTSQPLSTGRSSLYRESVIAHHQHVCKPATASTAHVQQASQPGPGNLRSPYKRETKHNSIPLCFCRKLSPSDGWKFGRSVNFLLTLSSYVF